MKELIKDYVKQKGLTFKEVAHRAGMNENGLHDKLRRGTITVADLVAVLDVLDKKLLIVNKDIKEIKDTKNNSL